MAYARPDLLHHILDITTQAVILYLNAQIEAGAQAVMIFDSWGGALSHAAYREFSLNYMQKIVAGLTREREGRRVPSVVFTKGGALWLEAQAAIGSDALGLDWTVDIGEARKRVGDQVALQATSIRSFCCPRPRRLNMKSAIYLPVTDTVAAMCSIWGTASRSSRRRKMPQS